MRFLKRLLKRVLIGLVIFLVLWAIAAPHILNFSTDDAKAIQEYRAKGIDLHFVTDTIEGKPIHYAITGADSLPTLVFIHGSPGSWDAFDPFMKDSALRAMYRMVSIDRPGYGGSADAGAMHLQDQSKLIVPVLRSLAHEGPLMLAGHSLGGPMVVQLAADDPQDIACIVLLAGSVSPAFEEKENWRYWFNTFPLKYLLPGAVRPSNVELLYFKKDVYTLAEAFPKVTCDVRIIHGDVDPMVPPGNVAYAKEKLVNARSVQVQMLPGANHFIPWTRTEIIQKALLDARSTMTMSGTKK